MQEQFETTGRFVTANGQKYMGQLCKHFAHKVPAEVVGDTGTVTFPMGNASLVADGEALTATVVGASPEAVARMQHIIDDHLQRFAFREDFANMDWSPSTPTA